MRMKKFMYKFRLFFSRFKKRQHYEQKGFIYEQTVIMYEQDNESESSDN